MKVFSVAFFCISALLLTGCFSTSEPRKIETKLEQGVQVSEAELASYGGTSSGMGNCARNEFIGWHGMFQ